MSLRPHSREKISFTMISHIRLGHLLLDHRTFDLIDYANVPLE